MNDASNRRARAGLMFQLLLGSCSLLHGESWSRGPGLGSATVLAGQFAPRAIAVCDWVSFSGRSHAPWYGREKNLFSYNASYCYLGSVLGGEYGFNHYKWLGI